MLSVKEVLPNLNLESITLPPSLTGGSLSSSRESSVEKEDVKINPIIITEASSPESDSLSLSASSLPLRRFVEGSDHITAESAASTSESRSLGLSSESRKEEAEKQRRAKSPSARVKDKSRVRSPRLHSPQDTDEEHLEHSSDRVDGLNSSVNSLHDNKSGSREEAPVGALVELLETEVDTLKDRLDEKHKELVKMQESNQDLKSRLQTVGREKDISQLWSDLFTASARDAESAKHNIADQQGEGSNTENAEVTTMRRQKKLCQEALRDLKQEKDKFMKMSAEWNKKIRNLELQLKESSAKVESQQEMMKIKENEIKRLETDLKANLQKIREYEREILKLKASGDGIQAVERKNG
uniref:Uncharacterized protein n=1 Tax=Magallana gigas TaxID=29159 RepID=A0A8W8HUH6_MAGGI